MLSARGQARQRAGARNERTLFAVACTPLLGRVWTEPRPETLPNFLFPLPSVCRMTSATPLVGRINRSHCVYRLAQPD